MFDRISQGKCAVVHICQKHYSIKRHQEAGSTYLPAATYLGHGSKTPTALLLLHSCSYILLLHLTAPLPSAPFSSHLEHIQFRTGLQMQLVSFPSTLLLTLPFSPHVP